MIELPIGWSVEQLPNAVALAHLTRSDAARIFYSERAGKPRSVIAHVREIVAGWPRYTAVSFGPVERMTTEEGELAAFVSATCREGDHPVQLDLGFVFTDEFITSITGVCSAPELGPEITDLVRELLRRDNLCLGARRRRFLYRPPTGWQPIPHGLGTEWISPKYPRHNTSILVAPATPIVLGGRARLGEAELYLEPHGWTVLETSPIELGVTRHLLALQAQDVRFERGDVRRVTRFVVLSDAIYQYPIEMRMSDGCDATIDRRILRELLDSVLPFGPVGVGQSTGAMQHWSE